MPHFANRRNLKSGASRFAQTTLAPSVEKLRTRPVRRSDPTTTTDGGGTITEYTPGSALTLKESSGPRRYRFGKTVTYVTKSGTTLDEETVKTRIKIGIPIHVHYTTEGDSMLVDRVILDED